MPKQTTCWCGWVAYVDDEPCKNSPGTVVPRPWDSNCSPPLAALTAPGVTFTSGGPVDWFDARCQNPGHRYIWSVDIYERATLPDAPAGVASPSAGTAPRATEHYHDPITGRVRTIR
jgi:hypothetical protein